MGGMKRKSCCKSSTFILLNQKLGDVDDIGAIDAAAATTAEDDILADPSSAEMSKSRVSV